MLVLRRVRNVVLGIVVVGYLVLSWSLPTHPGWLRPVLGVVVPVVLLGLAIGLGAGRWPNVRLTPELNQVLARWSTPINWQPVDLTRHGADFRKGGNEQARALLARFTGPPLRNNGDSPGLLWAARGEIEGVAVYGMLADLGLGHAGTGGGGRTPKPTVLTSVDTPVRPARLVVCRAAGYRRRGLYRAVAFWRLRTGNVGFDRQFFVFTDDRASARALLSPELVDWLIGEERAALLPLIFQNGTLSTGFSKRPKEQEGVHATAQPALADYLVGVLTRLPGN
jgi:hypothetical protein